MLRKIKEFINLSNKSRILNIFVLFVIVSAVPLTVFIAQKQQETRQRASEMPPITPPFPTVMDNNSNVYILEDDGTIVSPEGNIDLEKLSKLFYKKYPDSYDFLSVFTNFSVHTSNIHIEAQNHVENIGLPIEDIDQSRFGNTKRLLGVTYIGVNLENAQSIPRATARILLEEVSHQWGVFLTDPESKIEIQDKLAPLHWSMGLQTPKYYGAMREALPWKDNNNDTFSVERLSGNDDTIRTFHPFDLYLMGLMEPEEITEKYLLIKSKELESPERNLLFVPQPGNNNKVTVNGTAQKIGIEDIIRIAGGRRNPLVKDSQHNFTMAYVLLIKPGQTAKQGDLDALQFIAKNFPDWWAEATDHRSTMNKPTFMLTPTPTFTPSPTPFVCTACAADIDKSGRVDNMDYQRFIACLGKKSTETDALRKSCAPSDIDKNGIVGTADYNCLIQKFYQICNSTFITPTPFIFPTPTNIPPFPTKVLLK